MTDQHENWGAPLEKSGLGLRVVECENSIAKAVIPLVHYSRAKGMTTKTFCLCDGIRVVGVVTYGSPPLMVRKHAIHDEVGVDYEFLELTRLVVAPGITNGASFLVGRSLRLLAEKKPHVVVSYADTAHGHSGIVYQSTNWIYTGATVSHDTLYIIDGVKTHPRTLASRGITSPAKWAKDNGIQRVKPDPKHRYFFVSARNRKERRILTNSLKYEPVKEYPKSQKTMYETEEIPFILAPDLGEGR